MVSFIKSVDTGLIVVLHLLVLNFIGKSALRQNSRLSAERQVDTDILPRQRFSSAFRCLTDKIGTPYKKEAFVCKCSQFGGTTKLEVVFDTPYMVALPLRGTSTGWTNKLTGIS